MGTGNRITNLLKPSNGYLSMISIDGFNAKKKEKRKKKKKKQQIL